MGNGVSGDCVGEPTPGLRSGDRLLSSFLSGAACSLIWTTQPDSNFQLVRASASVLRWAGFSFEIASRQALNDFRVKTVAARRLFV